MLFFLEIIKINLIKILYKKPPPSLSTTLNKEEFSIAKFRV